MTGERSSMPNGPDAAAAEWLTRRASGADLSADPAFVAWLAESFLNAEAWAKAERLWASFDVEPDILLAAMRQTALEAREGGGEDDQENIVRRRKSVWPKAGALVAMAASILVGLNAVWHPDWLGLPAAVPKVSEHRYESPAGRRMTVQLADRTAVTLDMGTAIVAHLSDTERQVRLIRGQAFFAVRHDAARPFTVTAAGSSITDLGTQFNVVADPNGMRLLVVEGSVKVTNGAADETLMSGQGYDSSTAKRSDLRPADMQALLAWRTGYLEFRNEPLAQAVADMNRYGGHHIVLADPAIGSLPIAGRFEAGNTERFARTLEQIYGLRMIRRPDGTILLRNPDRPEKLPGGQD